MINFFKHQFTSFKFNQRSKMNFSISIALVGYPNVGKSTFFNALVKRQLAEAKNFPFCTIEPNIAKVAAVDEALIELSQITKNPNIKAYNIEVMDVAGLIKGSMTDNDGTGIKFLQCLRESTAIIQVLRCFKNPNIHYMDKDLNPINEMQVVQTELILSDIESIEKKIKRGDKKLTAEEKKFLEKVIVELNSGKNVRQFDFSNITEKEKKLLDSLNLISIKPFVYVFNVEPPEIENEYTKLLENTLKDQDKVITSCVLENEALQLAEDSPIMESLEIINNYFATFPNFQFQSWKLIEKIIKKLDYVTFYSIGETNLNQSWIIKKGSSIVDAAGAIHSDFAKKFICAEISSIDDWRKYRTEESIKSAGKMKVVSRDYIVQDGDIINVKFRN
jgi:GTP-binding protein YchF